MKEISDIAYKKGKDYEYNRRKGQKNDQRR